MSELTHGEGYAPASLDETDEAGIVVARGKDGYVGRDGQAVGDNPRGGLPGAAA
jgi:hypothetical protein